MNSSDAWLWMGWNFQEIPCGITLYVVACKPGPSLSIQVHHFLVLSLILNNGLTKRFLITEKLTLLLENS